MAARQDKINGQAKGAAAKHISGYFLTMFTGHHFFLPPSCG
jgi:hypothetical protein